MTLAREPSEPVQAVLLEVYRDDGEEAQVCERLVDLDEGFQEWRYRHVKMVERTIGDKVGTGGSPGAYLLRTTLFSPRVSRPVGDPQPDGPARAPGPPGPGSRRSYAPRGRSTARHDARARTSSGPITRAAQLPASASAASTSGTCT